MRNACFKYLLISMASIQELKVSPERLMQFGFAYAPPLIIGAAVASKVFDALAGGPKSLEDTSRETGASVRGLRAIMRKMKCASSISQRARASGELRSLKNRLEYR